MCFRVLTTLLTTEQKCSLLEKLLFGHIFFHSGVEFFDGFHVLGGSEFGVNLSGDLNPGVTENALCSQLVHA